MTGTLADARPKTTGRSARSATTSWSASGRSRDLDADAILAIGARPLRVNLEARRAAAREIDPDADLPSVIDQVRSNETATFDEALQGYRDVMRRARAYLIEHDIVSIPNDETIEVLPTPEYLRSVMPFSPRTSTDAPVRRRRAGPVHGSVAPP